MNKYGPLTEGHDRRKHVPVQLCSPQTSQGPTWD